MRRNIVIAKKAISADLCNTIIERTKKDFNTATTFEGNKPDIRKSEVSWLLGSVKHYDIYQPIINLIKKINDEVYKFELLDPEPFQITQYDEKNQGFYKPHMDGTYDHVPHGHGVRKLSLSIQLTPPNYYEGGTFEFPDDKEKFVVEDSMDQGTAIFFPSYMKHGVKPVTKGTRYSLVCWVLGPNFQ